MNEIHILGIHQDPDETPTPLWQRMFAVAEGDMTKFFPTERFLSRELVWAISQREPFPERYFYYDGFLFCDVTWLGDIIIKYAPNEVMREFLNFTELVVAELRKLPQPALH